MEYTEDDLFKWRNIPCCCMERVNLIKLLPTQINIHIQYNFIKIPVRYFDGLDKNNLKISGRIKIHEYLREFKKKKQQQREYFSCQVLRHVTNSDICVSCMLCRVSVG